jgi:hypothetical protein
MIARRNEWIAEKKPLFHHNTTGFRRQKSTLENIGNLVLDVNAAQVKNEVTLTTFLDIQGAYNNVHVKEVSRVLNVCNNFTTYKL